MNNKYQGFEEEQDIPVGIPVNMPQVTENAFNELEASKIKFRSRETQSKNQNPQQIPQHYQQHSNQMPPQPYYPQAQQPYAQPYMMQGPPLHQPQNQRVIHPTFTKPEPMKCPCCKMDIVTVMNQETGNSTYLWAGSIFCATLCCFGAPYCCCIPFMMNSCMDKSHYCPQCGFNIIRKHKGCCDF